MFRRQSQNYIPIYSIQVAVLVYGPNLNVHLPFIGLILIKTNKNIF